MGHRVKLDIQYPMQTSANKNFYLEVLLHTKYSINTLSLVHCDHDWKLNNRFIPDYDLWYVKKGQGSVWINGELFPLQAGCVYFFRPGDVISASQNEDQPLSVYYCHFQTDIHWFFPQVRIQQGCNAKNQKLEFHLFQGLQLQRTGSFTPEDQRLMLLMVFHLLFKAKGMSFYSQEITPLDIERFDKALAYMDEHIGKTITLIELEQVLCMEKSGINSLFRTITGMSTIQFFTKLRMNKAKLLLRKGTTITQTAQNLGYPDLYSFSKVFKRHTGISPRTYSQSSFESFE